MELLPFRTTPDIYADPARQSERSRASVAGEMATLPARVLSAAEEDSVRINAAGVIGAEASPESRRRLAKIIVSSVLLSATQLVEFNHLLTVVQTARSTPLKL